MKFKSTQDLSALESFYNQVKELAGFEVQYGYFDEVHYSGLNMATLAATHEQGWNGLPQRDFIYSTQLAFKGDLQKHLTKMYRNMIAGKGYRADLNAIGKAGVKGIKQTIDSGHFSNNRVSESWASVKGFSEALIHYGDLRAATTFKVATVKKKNK